jgi:hypothetical protein
VEDGARKRGDGPRGHGECVARIVTGVADHVVGLVIAMVLDNVAGASARVGQQVHGAVGFGDVVERDPAREVRPMWIGDET